MEQSMSSSKFNDSIKSQILDILDKNNSIIKNNILSISETDNENIKLKIFNILHEFNKIIETNINDILDKKPEPEIVIKSNKIIETKIVNETDKIIDKKQQIIKLFNENVKNKKIIIESKYKNCDSAEGYWIETQMGLKHNSDNAPDILGYEMKKDSKKITFRDYSASEYIFSVNKPVLCLFNKWNDKNIKMTRDEFIKYFGNANVKKNGRFSWSGKCVPTYGEYNNCGQKISIDDDNNICIFYKYDKDQRDHIKEYDFLKKGKILNALYRLIGSKTGKHRIKGMSIKEKKEYLKIPASERLTAHDIEQGTVTVSNIGSVYPGQTGVTSLLEIVPPQVCAIAVGAVQDRALVVSDGDGYKSVEARPVLPLCIAFDHRALDFGDVVPFIKRLDEIFDNPEIIRSWSNKKNI